MDASTNDFINKERIPDLIYLSEGNTPPNRRKWLNCLLGTPIKQAEFDWLPLHSLYKFWGINI